MGFLSGNLAWNCNKTWKYHGKESEANMEIITTTSDEILNICKDININKASCIDNISSEILRDAFMVLPTRLGMLFNTCFNSAIIPPEWKIAKITPLPKAGNSKIVSNYRPISLLPLLSKLIEKIVHRRIYNHLEFNNLLDKRQGGFRPNHSSVKTCSYFVNDINSAINNNQFTIAVYIDAMKAFDTVNHAILLQKMSELGIQGNVLAWTKNYLSERYQRTMANNIVSKERLITWGVTQGRIIYHIHK